MKADFWLRDDRDTEKIATLIWDGKTTQWGGIKAGMIEKLLAEPFQFLDGKPFDPDKHWDKLEELISGSRLWAVVGEKESESVSVDDLFPETLSIPKLEPREVNGPVIVDLSNKNLSTKEE